jgi:hypothetical protein
MTVTATWNVANLEHEVATGKVTIVHYTIDSTDGTYNAGAYGSIGVDGEVTVDYPDLTPQICIGWVHDALGAEKVADIEQALADNIELQKNPVSESGVPW